jgi:hypothetical protein
MLMAHAVTHRIVGSAGYLRVDDNGAIRLESKGNTGSRQPVSHAPAAP